MAPANIQRPDKVPCAYLAQGWCKNGANCPYSHAATSLQKAKVQRCVFFDRGYCKSGDRCTFRHVTGKSDTSKQPQLTILTKPSTPQPPATASPSKPQNSAPAPWAAASTTATSFASKLRSNQSEENNYTDFQSKYAQIFGPPGESTIESTFPNISTDTDNIYTNHSAPESSFRFNQTISYDELLQRKEEERIDYTNIWNQPVLLHHIEAAFSSSPSLIIEDDNKDSRPICKYFIRGECLKGDLCYFQHTNIPGANVDMECGICMEWVLASDRRFGILTNCDHAFCLECIRGWRGNNDSFGDQVQLCPLCRERSYFVVPSTRWVGAGPDKLTLIEGYKEKLSNIPCRWFNFGDGQCPFSTSCLYAHRNKDGSLANPPVLRKRLNEEGEMEIMTQLRISDFL